MPLTLALPASLSLLNHDKLIKGLALLTPYITAVPVGRVSVTLAQIIRLNIQHIYPQMFPKKTSVVMQSPIFCLSEPLSWSRLGLSTCQSVQELLCWRSLSSLTNFSNHMKMVNLHRNCWMLLIESLFEGEGGREGRGEAQEVQVCKFSFSYQ